MAFPVLPRLDGASDGQLETAGPFGVVWLLFTEFYWFSFLGFMFLFFFGFRCWPRKTDRVDDECSSMQMENEMRYDTGRERASQ